MGRRTAFFRLVFLCCIVLLASGPAQAEPLAQDDYGLSWYVIGGAGQMGMIGDDQTMGLTAGQTAIGWSGNGTGLGSGFWYGVRWAMAYSDIYLPIVIRADAAP
jgi:hypothetical protein